MNKNEDMEIDFEPELDENEGFGIEEESINDEVIDVDFTEETETTDKVETKPSVINNNTKVFKVFNINK